MPNNNSIAVPCQSLPLVTTELNRHNAQSRPSGVSRMDGSVVFSEGATPISCPPQVVNHGFDTIHINFWIDWTRTWKLGLFEALSEKKAYLQSGMDNEMPFHMGKSEIFAWNLQRNGSRFQKYKLTTGDVSMYLDPRDHNRPNPNMVLQIGSLSSQQDPVSFVAQFINWINYMGGLVIREEVSRIDICADYKTEISDTGIFALDHWITRAMKHDFHGSNRSHSGVTIGRGDILLRVYAKQQEMKEKQALEKLLFFNGLWKTNSSESVTRVEFQLRGTALKEMFLGEKPLFLMALNISFIWSYLTEKWFRLSDSPVDRENKNQAHSKTSQFWLDIQKASSFLAPPIVRNRKQRHINIPALKKQIAGCLLTVCAGVGHAVDDLFGMMATSQEIIQSTVCDLVNDIAFKKRFLSKQLSAVVSF